MSKAKFNDAARMALAHYRIGDYALDFLAHGENVTYRVVNTQGEQFLLRLHRSVSNVFGGEWLRPEIIRCEALWLQALAKGTGLVLQAPVYNRFGNFVTEVKDGDGKPLMSTLLSWINGSHLKKNTKESIGRLGSLVGQMQKFAIGWKAPERFVRRLWDWDRFWSRLDDLRKGIKLGTVSTLQYEKYEQALKKVQLVMATLSDTPDRWGMIHGDLHRDNYLIYENEIRPIDFSLCGFGYYLYEVADTLRYIESELRPVFMQGYCEHMVLPQDYLCLIEAFFIAGTISNQAYLALNPMDFEHLSKKVREQPEYVDERVLKFLDDQSFLTLA